MYEIVQRTASSCFPTTCTPSIENERSPLPQFQWQLKQGLTTVDRLAVELTAGVEIGRALTAENSEPAKSNSVEYFMEGMTCRNLRRVCGEVLASAIDRL